MSEGSRSAESYYEEKQMKPVGAIPLSPGVHEKKI
jgi:hypothetical protein